MGTYLVGIVKKHGAWNQLCLGPDTPDAIFRFSLTDKFDSSLYFPNI
jgi:hypothetical protein